jgi:CHASE3 domain sensor protein
MSDWFYQLPVVWMALLIFTTTYLVSFGVWSVVMALAVRHGPVFYGRINAGMLSPLGTIFGFLVVFLAVQVWNDSQRAHEAVLHEAGALRTAVVLASNLSSHEEARIDALIARHIQECANRDWPAMAHQRADIVSVPAALTEALRVALTEVPTTEGQMTSQRELARSLEEALQARRERIIISQQSINWVKWAALGVEALLVLVTIGMVHCDHGATAAVAMGIFATAVATAALLIASHSRPFTGQISVSPQVLWQVMPMSKP